MYKWSVTHDFVCNRYCCEHGEYTIYIIFHLRVYKLEYHSRNVNWFNICSIKLLRFHKMDWITQYYTFYRIGKYFRKVKRLLICPINLQTNVYIILVVESWINVLIQTNREVWSTRPFTAWRILDKGEATSTTSCSRSILNITVSNKLLITFITTVFWATLKLIEARDFRTHNHWSRSKPEISEHINIEVLQNPRFQNISHKHWSCSKPDIWEHRTELKILLNCCSFLTYRP